MEAPSLFLSCIFTLFKHNIPLDVLPITVREQVANYFNPYWLLDEGLNYDRSTYFYIMKFLYENTILIRSRGLHAILPKIFLSIPFSRIVLDRVETRLNEPEMVFVDAWSRQGSCKHMLCLFYFCLNTSLYEKWLFWRECAHPSVKNDIPLQLFHPFVNPFNPHRGNMLVKYPAIDLFWWLTPPVRRKYIIGTSVVYIRIYRAESGGERVCLTLSPFRKCVVYRLG